MSNWIRLWEDMPNDPKWRVVATRANVSFVSNALHCVTVRDVVSVFVHMLICAGNGKNCGTLDGWNDEVVAAALDAEPELIIAIREAMDGLVLDGNRLKSWEKRQPNREDKSTDRVRAFRAKRNAPKRTETHPKRTETHRKRDETQCNAPDSDSESTTTPFGRSSSRAPARETTTTTRKIRKIKFPIANTGPDEQQIRDAEKHGLTEPAAIEAEWMQFRDYNLAKGGKLADWHAAWRRWLDKSGQFRPPKTGPPKAVARANGRLVFVERGTPQWIAWENFYRKSKGYPPPHDIRRGTSQDGWHFPTEWPQSSG